MEKLKKSWLAVSVVVTFFVTAPQHGVAGDLRLTAVVYDHANLGDGKLAEVENTTSEIFRRTGVQLVWIEGFGYAAKRRDELTPAREGPATLVVKLQPESEAARYGVRSVCGGIGFASGAIIFVHRFDPRSTVSEVTRIGHVIAHEIGHVLLGPNAHSIVGIMRGTLLQQDWENAAQGTLGFTQSQSQQIRTWIAERGQSGDAQLNGWMAGPGQKSSQSPGAELKIEPALQVRVLVYNGVPVSSRDLIRAEERAGRVFEKANIIVIWSAGPMPKDPSPDAAHEQWVPSDLQLRIWTRSLAQPSMIDSDALGFCSSIEGGQAVVLFDAVRSLVRGRFSDPADLLGLAIAHEIGHILLRSVNHSTAGIMRARWLPSDLHDAETGSLLFTREQSRSMQNEVRRRMGLQIARHDCGWSGPSDPLADTY
jgi:hypothetical protein